MKELSYRVGDLLTDTSIDIIGHCCNCHNTFGSGIAKSIKQMYPAAYAADTQHYKKYSGNILGTFSKASVKRGDNTFYVYNLYGQKSYGNDGNRYVDYEAIYSALTFMCADIMGKYQDDCPSIGFPYKMASDRAGGHFAIIETMIRVVFKDYPGKVSIVELK